MTTISYTVRRKFKSEGKIYEKGDAWQPIGDERKDNTIINGGFVVSDITVTKRVKKTDGN